MEWLSNLFSNGGQVQGDYGPGEAPQQQAGLLSAFNPGDDPRKKAGLLAFANALIQAGAPRPGGASKGAWIGGLGSAMGEMTKGQLAYDQQQQAKEMQQLQLQKLKQDLNQKVDPLSYFGKFDANNHTPESIAEFMATKNPSVLRPRTKVEIAPSGEAIDPHNPANLGKNFGKPLALDTGGTTGFLNPGTFQPVASFAKTQTPDSVASTATSMRGQNMTDSRARDFNAIARDAAGPRLTKGQEAVDREFGKTYAEYQAGGGSADVEKQLTQLDRVATELGAAGNNYTGPVRGLAPDKVRAVTNAKAVAAKNAVEEVAQRNLRLVLGAQFTQVEGERLIARAYNDQMPPAENQRRVKALANQIREAAKAKEDAARYFEKNGTLTGWTGRMPTLSDFESAIDGAGKGNRRANDASNSAGDVRVVDW